MNGDFNIKLDNPVAAQLVRLMITNRPGQRIDIECVKRHPIFYTPAEYLDYLTKINERFDAKNINERLLQELSWQFDHPDWREDLTPGVRESLKRDKARKRYDIYSETVLNLVKAIRNKYAHFNEEGPDNDFGTIDTYWEYWSARFPHLVPLLYEIIPCTGYKELDYIKNIYGSEANAKVVQKNLLATIARRETPLAKRLSAGTGNISLTCWRPKTNHLFASSESNLIFSTITKTDQKLVFVPVSDTVLCFDWSTERDEIALGFKSGAVKVYSTHGKLIETYTGHKNMVYTIKWSPSGKYLAAGSRDESVMVWERWGKPTGQKLAYKAWGWNRHIRWQTENVFFGSSGHKLVFFVTVDNELRRSWPYTTEICPVILTPFFKYLQHFCKITRVAIFNKVFEKKNIFNPKFRIPILCGARFDKSFWQKAPLTKVFDKSFWLNFSFKWPLPVSCTEGFCLLKNGVIAK